MNLDIALLLVREGIAGGAIYALLALGTVLVFNITRIALVSYGDLIAYSALTLASIQSNKLPGTVWLVLILAGLALLLEGIDLYRRKRLRASWRSLFRYGVLPSAPVVVALLLPSYDVPMAFQIVLTIALILPLGPLLYRVVFQPMRNASVLTLLMAAAVVHFPMAGLALLFFGAEGYKTKEYISGNINLGVIDISAESIVVVTALVFISVALYGFFERTLWGKALRATAVNAIGARIVGIRVASAGTTAFLIAAGLAAVTGVLIGPSLTVYSDTGFLIGLKGFVGAAIGGIASYPLALFGALLVGIMDSFASFYSSALKDIAVFALLIPIVLFRGFWIRSEVEEEEDL
ncbi:branched-chain amino acid ABC transporter permease [Undibacter mobilis]|uniref:Branched-chain amino acid ABC transporter permease n=1 Tax=Undibacter mobilis TaxID=2292256 RepID=A0A371B9M3_9BRAD|nr:branched-chain amino acid ABC transporter permease [Undibacter mobilis]RDV04280.1 branched-chain amino acid ABC transporter permease [Undibacter mobilis]